MKVVLLACLATTLLAACSKKAADPQPTADPTAESSLARTMVYPSRSTSNGASYAPTSLQTTGSLDAAELSVSVDAPKGQDYIGFTVPRATLSAGLLGTYQLQDRQGSAGAVVKTWYTYHLVNTPTTTSSRIFLSKDHDMRGQLVITAYDEKRRLLSGSFEMRMNDVADPQEENAGPNSARADVQVSGTFTNLKLQ